jgi:hypothetical protein
MKTRLLGIWLTAPLLAIFWMGSAQAVLTYGEAVSAGGIDDASVGLPPVSNEIEYFIPLLDSHSGTYGAAAGGICDDTGEAGIGTCADTGTGSGYSSADSLMMNLFFDLTGSPDSSEATLSINFEDLDLTPINDPTGFNESLQFSYWNVDSNSFVNIGGVIDHVDELESGAFSGAASTTPDTPVDPFTWHLDLAALGILDNTGGLNDSVSTLDGFWIQLGFGSQYTWSDGSPRTGTNTSEFLTAELNVSPVPVPAAFWLFGTALIGFVGMSRRTKVS